jgi:carbonic anhydrase
MNALNAETQSAISPSRAIELLKEGNSRYINGNMIDRNLNLQQEQTSDGQWPFAAVLGCIDSRVPSELIFDQGIGDLFNARVAGNFSNPDILGSLEYSCKVAGAKAVVVLGHSACGAVKGACDNVELGNITRMLENLKPAIEAVTDETENRTSSNAGFVQKVVESNVHLTVDDIRRNSPTLKEMEANGEIVIIAAVYDVASGKVDFK